MNVMVLRIALRNDASTQSNQNGFLCGVSTQLDSIAKVLALGVDAVWQKANKRSDFTLPLY